MQAMKVIERIAYSPVRQVMTIDWVHWEDLNADGIIIGYAPKRVTTEYKS